MNNYDKVKLIKDKIEKFKDVSFYSLADNNSIIIENKKTSALYEIKYNEENGIYTFDTNDVVLLKPKNKTLKETFSEHALKLHNGVKQIFSEENFDNSVNNLKQLIKTLPNINYSEEPIEYHKSNKKFKKKIIGNSLENKYQQMEEIKKEYFKNYIMFNENNDIIEKVFEIDKLEKMYNESEKTYKIFVDNIEKFTKLNNELIAKYNEDTAKEIIDSIMKQELKVAIPKAAVKIKSSINEEFNIIDSTKEITTIIKNIFEEQEPSVSSSSVFNLAKSNIDMPKFLKFRVDLYSLEDLRQLVSELTLALSSIGSISPEEMHFINEKKMQAEYMLRTGLINDKLVQEIIDSFNERFAHDSSDMMNDNARGFDSVESMNDNNVIGKAEIEVTV
jgi:hypothetical protein